MWSPEDGGPSTLCFNGPPGPSGEVYKVARIAIIDDEREWRDVYFTALSEAGHTVETYPSGSGDTLAEISGGRFDLVVLDIRMSPSGRQVMHDIREIMPGMPVVISSSYAGYRTDPDFESAGAFVEKSVDIAALCEAVNAVLAARPEQARRRESSEPGSRTAL